MANSNEEVIKEVKNMMILSGLWPKYEESNFYKFKKLLSVIAPFVLTVLMFDQLIENLQYIDKVTDILCVFASFVSYLIKLTIFDSKSKRFSTILQELKQNTFVDYPKEFNYYLMNTIKMSKYVARLYQISCLAVIVTYSVKPFVIDDGQRLPLPVTFKVGKLYYVLYMFQSFSLFTGAWNNSSLDALAMGLMGIAATQLDILREKLLSLNKYSKENGNSNVELMKFIRFKIKRCVIHHICIIRYG